MSDGGTGLVGRWGGSDSGRRIEAVANALLWHKVYCDIL